MKKYSYIKLLKEERFLILFFILFSIFFIYIATENIDLAIATTEIIFFPFFSPDIISEQDYSKQIRPKEYKLDKKKNLIIHITVPIILSVILIFVFKTNILLLIATESISITVALTLIYSKNIKNWILSVSAPLMLLIYAEFMNCGVRNTFTKLGIFGNNVTAPEHLYMIITYIILWGIINFIILFTGKKKRAYTVFGVIHLFINGLNFLTRNINNEPFSIMRIKGTLINFQPAMLQIISIDNYMAFIEGLLIMMVYFILINKVVKPDEKAEPKEKMIQGSVGTVIVLGMCLFISAMTRWDVTTGYNYSYIVGALNRLVCDLSLKRI